MIEQKKRNRTPHPPRTLTPAALAAEIRKSGRGAVIAISGVMNITELTDERISLSAHSGRVEIRGVSLSLSVFENRTVEISGKIEGVEFGYGKA